MHVLSPTAAQQLMKSPGAGPTSGPDADSFAALLRSQSPPPPAAEPGPSGPASGPLQVRPDPVVPPELVDVITRLRQDERQLDRYLKRALAGQQFEMPQLVALQSLAFKYSQRVELLGKVVDRLAGAVKQTLQMQV